MKSIGMLSVMALVLSGWISANGQGMESEVPGDNFSLEGALELFKKSESPEHFEKLLNSPDSKVNNLDLNGDGYIDYIRVFDRHDGNVHAFILQAVVSETENQDVAVIELEKLANGKAVLQIVGDEDIYGVTTIIEPTREVRTYGGTNRSATVVNVWAWPTVQYVYSPYYTNWYSPWGWHMRPIWWRTWRPVAYVHYHPIWVSYRPHYAYCHTRRVVYAHQIYRPYRTTSVIVHNRHHSQIAHYRSSYPEGNRNGRDRNDARRSTINNDRSYNSSTDRQRRDDFTRQNSTQRETPGATDRKNTRGQNIPDTRQTRKEDFQYRGPNTVPNNGEIRSRENNTESRTRTQESRPEIQQRSNTRERNAPAEVNRTSSDFQKRSTVPDNREIRPKPTPPSENRTRTVEGRPAVQQTSNTRERSAPPAMNRNTSEMKRNDSPNSRPAFDSGSRSPKPASVDRSRSTSAPAAQTRPDNRNFSPSGESKRGRN